MIRGNVLIPETLKEPGIFQGEAYAETDPQSDQIDITQQKIKIHSKFLSF